MSSVVADEGNEDSWLYGNEVAQAHFENAGQDNSAGSIENQNNEPEDSRLLDTTTEQDHLDNHPDFEDALGEEAGDGQNTNDSKFEDDGEDSDDSDDINVVIGDIKSTGTYNIKQRPGAQGPAQATDKPKLQTGKFNIEEFESVGTINGAPAHEYNIESIEDKPWRKPGADITDYFNYGFNEDTWRAYCERQKKIRIHESGVGLASLTVNSNAAGNNMNDPNKMGIRIGFNRSGPPPRPGLINVIGGGNNMNPQGMQQMIRPPAPKENVIQVMTADRREYSRTVVSNKFELPPPAFNPEDLIYHHENDAFNYGYEPTQDSQWGPDNNPGWVPSDIKELTPGQPHPGPGGPMHPQMVPPVMGMPPGPMGMPIQPLNLPPPMRMPMGMPMNRNMMPGDKDRERDDRRDRDKNEDLSERRRYDRGDRRERERSTSRDRDRRERERGERERERRDRDRDRERERRTVRSRSRERSSRRERSKSRDRERERSSRRERERERSASKEKSSRKDKKSHKKEKTEAAE